MEVQSGLVENRQARRSKSRGRRTNLPFPCLDCKEFSYPTALGLQMHRKRFCALSHRIALMEEVREDAGEEVRVNAKVEVKDKANEDFLENLAETNHPKKKAIKRKSQQQQRVDLPFLCPSCRECSYATNFGLQIHINRFCEARKREGQSEQAENRPAKRSKSRCRRMDLPFACLDCQEFSYPTALGLQQHRA